MLNFRFTFQTHDEDNFSFSMIIKVSFFLRNNTKYKHVNNGEQKQYYWALKAHDINQKDWTDNNKAIVDKK